MVVGRKAMLPSLLIFSSVNGRVGSESACVCMCVIEYATGSREVMLLSTQCLYAGIASWTLSFSLCTLEHT